MAGRQPATTFDILGSFFTRQEKQILLVSIKKIFDVDKFQFLSLDRFGFRLGKRFYAVGDTCSKKISLLQKDIGRQYPTFI